MKIKDKFNGERTVFSFEVFPPKRDGSLDKIYEALSEMAVLSPDFISVTYGAGGSVRDHKTEEIASWIKNELGIESAAHLTCVNSDRDDVLYILDRLNSGGVENVLALRGDITEGQEPRNVFPHASDLAAFIRENDPSIGISGACYPEGHPESPDMIADIKNLKKKVDAGAEHLVSQLFFDNSIFYDFCEKARIAGIDTPIEAGIMPVVNKKQIERMVSLCGASLPAKFTRMMSRYGDRDEAIRDAGIAYAIDQIIDLVVHGVQGIHLYTMNDPDIARRIHEGIKNLL
ncbi:MAG: methylenetetrahydrofolate reductase [Firmicutes bacterium]|nr:methylenetetrahydrofolate reductase [NAD(P)H] [Bacillota bacterium]